MGLIFLLLANGVVLFQLAQSGLDSSSLIWTYWMQSVIMVFTWSFRLKRMGYGKAGTAVDLGIDVNLEGFGRTRTAADFSGVQGFLVVGLGFFAIYGILIGAFLGAPNWFDLSITLPGFLLAHLGSVWQFREQKDQGESILAAFAQRMVPMHLMVILLGGLQGAGASMTLVILKTCLDVGAHVWEHRNATQS